MIPVNNKTKVYGVIGNPVSHSLSPLIHHTIASKLGDNLMYHVFHVEERNIREAIIGAHALHVSGLNITMPFKAEVMQYLSSYDNTAVMAGAANTLKYSDSGFVGYNTDIAGIIGTLRRNKITIKGEKVAVIGAGGTARSACIAMCEEGAKKIIIANRSLENADILAEQVRKFYDVDISVLPIDELSESVELLIQTTSCGFGELKNESPITDFEYFKKVKFAFDAIYEPWETKFLKDAKAMGCTAVNGFEMLVFQAAASYGIWMGKELDYEFVSDIADELLKLESTI